MRTLLSLIVLVTLSLWLATWVEFSPAARPERKAPVWRRTTAGWEKLPVHEQPPYRRAMAVPHPSLLILLEGLIAAMALLLCPAAARRWQRRCMGSDAAARNLP